MGSNVNIVRSARELATQAHAGQTDKAGNAYIGHPARVAARCADNPEAEAAAWLHDVVEDCGITLDDLRRRGFPESVVGAVDALTRRPGGEPAAYYARVVADPLALVVKLADLADNTDPERLAVLDEATRSRLEAKYAAAYAALGRGFEERRMDAGGLAMNQLPANGLYVEYLGSEYPVLFYGDDWDALPVGRETPGNFPDAIEWGEGKRGRWVVIPRSAVSRRWQRTVTAMWHSARVWIARNVADGQVEILYAQASETPVSLGFEGDRQSGWTKVVDSSEIVVTTVYDKEDGST